MSERAGAPAHRVLRVLLDRYIQRMPASARNRVARLLQLRRDRHLQ
jgi:hypothetical protein